MYQHLTKLLLAGVIAAFGFAGSANAFVIENDTCEVGGGAGDIEILSASYDAANDLIIVELRLCDTKANNIKYRVHIDHTAPFFDDPPEFCATTSDDTMKRFKGNKDTGPGAIVVSTTNVNDDTLTYTVAVDDLDPTLMLGDTVFIWADTQHKGIIDRAPDTDGTDSCSKPEVETEVVALTLEPRVLIFVSSSKPNGNLGGIAGADTICNNLATAAGLPGAYKAWLADVTEASAPGNTFFQSPVPYMLPNGNIVAADWAALTNALAVNLINPVDVDELGVEGQFPFTSVWTNVTAGGLRKGSDANSSCNGWTTADAGTTGRRGLNTQVTRAWTDISNLVNCSSTSLHLYCVGQGIVP